MRTAVFTAAMMVAGLGSTSATAQQMAVREYETQEPATAPVATIVAANAVSPDEVQPVLPAGMAASFAAPPHDASGGYVTPNRDLSPEEVTWHVRVALNVAALGCRQQANETAAAYNALLTADKAVLAAALDGVGLRYKAKFGPAWQAANDAAMTKLYNFWAQPPAQDGFCREANAVLHEAQGIAPAAFPAFAAAVLPRLEAPFLTAFAAIDDYRVRMARWNDRHAAQVVIATVAAVPVGPRMGPSDP